MRRTILKKTTAVVVVVILAGAIGSAVFKNRLHGEQTPGVEYGERLFNSFCSGCHYAGKPDFKVGPGLIGLFKRDGLPVSGRPVTRENVLDQLVSPYRAMPSFAQLPRRDLDAIVAYLKTL